MRKNPLAILCSIDGCGRPMRARNLCSTHWARWRRTGAVSDKPVRVFLLPIAERFWANVDKTSECWLWTGAKNGQRGGYGYITGTRGERRYLAHRLSWEIHNGPIPKGMFVCHHCDNPPCVRIDHLFLGTSADNVRDMIAKRRNLVGEQRPNAVFTDERVREARRRWGAGESIASIQHEFGISEYAVWAVVHRKTWKHIE